MKYSFKGCGICPLAGECPKGVSYLRLPAGVTAEVLVMELAHDGYSGLSLNQTRAEVVIPSACDGESHPIALAMNKTYLFTIALAEAKTPQDVEEVRRYFAK